MVAFFQNIFVILSGPLGVAIVMIFLIKGIIMSMREHRLAPFETALIGGGAFYGLAWIGATVLQSATG